MEVSLAVICDYASVSQEGKLNIMGVFQEINPPVLPFAFPMMYLVVEMEAGIAEADTQKHIQILLIDQDGNQMLDFQGDVTVPPIAAPGGRAYTNINAGLNGLNFEAAGNYAFHILVNGEEKRTVPLKVNSPPAAIGGADE